MFGIDRQQAASRSPDPFDQGRAAADQALLVRKGQGRAGRRGRPGRAQSRRADDGGHDPVGGPGRGLDHRLIARGDLYPGSGQRLAQLVQPRGIGRDRQLRLPAPRLFGQPGDIGAAGQSLDLEHAGPGCLGLIHQIQRRTADRARRAQHRHPPPDHAAPPVRPTISRPQATTTTANISPSTRSSRPPWPGISLPASLTP